MHPSYFCHWSTLGFCLFPYLCHLKYRSFDSRTAKRFTHITAEFLVGVLGSLRQKKKLSSSPCFYLLSLFCEVGVVSGCCGKGAQNQKQMPFLCAVALYMKNPLNTDGNCSFSLLSTLRSAV